MDGGGWEKGREDGLSLPRLKGGEGGAPQEEEGVTAGEAPWVNCAASRSRRRRRKSVSGRLGKLITPICWRLYRETPVGVRACV